MTPKYIDLHCHTTFSDGTLTPEEVISLGEHTGLSALAITDHDTVDAIPFALEAAKIHSLEVIPGIELATGYGTKNTEIHIVGLFIDCKNPSLLSLTEKIVAERNARNSLMIKKLNSLGFEITLDELKAESGGKIISRPHYARLMVSKGYVKDISDAFSKYIGDGKAGYVKRSLPTPEEVISAILSSGGIPILAHPTLYSMNYNEIRKMVDEFKSLGLLGIEVMYSTYNHEQEREITRIAKEKELLFSGGSDFHGENKKGIHLGTGKGNLRIPYEFLDKMKAVL